MPDRRDVLDAVVVGGGFAGLAVSGALKAAGLSHVVFEKSRPCQTWLTQRWDSFRMNTPNVLTVMPGEVYRGPDPEGAMTRDEFVASVLAYAERQALPLESGTAVSTVEPDDRGGFAVRTPQGVVRARNVVATTGNLNVPKRPALAARLPATVTQIDGSDYRSAGDLRPGAVLVVGCGNSGGQIAEDLALAGRQVFLATGRNGRVPRRYRGRDIILWLMEDGRYDQPRTVQSGRPLLGATHTLSLGSLSALGITLLGRIADVTAGGTLVIADDLAANAAYADKVSADIRREIDDYIARQGLDAEPATVDPGRGDARPFPRPADPRARSRRARDHDGDLERRLHRRLPLAARPRGDRRCGPAGAVALPLGARDLLRRPRLARSAQVGDDHGRRRRVPPHRRSHRGASGAQRRSRVSALTIRSRPFSLAYVRCMCCA